MIIIAFFSIFIAIVDQLLKGAVISKVSLHQTIELIPSFFSITRIRNFGAAFSLFGGNIFFLCLISIFILIFFYIYFLKEKAFTPFQMVIYSMFLGGTFGNLFDRITRGYVIDYLDFTIFGYHFPVFNFADIMITLSVVLLIFKMIMEDAWKTKD